MYEQRGGVADECPSLQTEPWTHYAILAGPHVGEPEVWDTHTPHTVEGRQYPGVVRMLRSLHERLG